MVFMMLGGKQFDRYLLPVYPPLILLAAIGWYWGLSQLVSRFNLKFKWQVVLLSLLVGLQLASLLPHYPYYLSYYNPLWGGPSAAMAIFDVGWGEGYDQAADYFTSLEGYQDFKISIYGSTAPFAFYFPWQKEREMYLAEWDAENLKIFKSSDYYLLYTARLAPEHQGQGVEDPLGVDPVYTVWFQGIPYVRIYRVADFPSDAPFFDRFTVSP
jgi:hypothetical protein